MGRKELQQQAVLGVEKALRRQPTNWRHNLAPYILLVERTNKLLAELTVAEMREAFPASEHADDQARNESAWQRKEDMEKTLGSIGLSAFFRMYRVNDSLNEYAKLCRSLHAILRPRNFVERVRTRAMRSLNLRP